MKLFQAFQARANVPVSLPNVGALSTATSSAYQPFYLHDGNLLQFPTGTTNPVITQQGLTGVPAAWACMNLAAHSCASMLVSGDVYDALGNEIHPVPSVISRPNPMYRSYEFWHEVITTLLMYGNYVGVRFNGMIVPVHPTNVECRISNEGMPVYRIGQTLYASEDILHIRGFTSPGTWWGIGVIEAQRKSLATSVNLQNYSASTFETGAIPTAVIHVPERNPSAASLTALGDDWQNTFSQSNRKPVVLPQGVTVEPLAWSPLDSQFLEAAKFDIAQVALMFGFDPGVFGASIGGSSLTYANLTQQNMAVIQRTYAPWIMRVEEAWTELLPDGYSFVACPEALLRMDTTARYESYRTALEAGFLTVDEVRELEGRPPLGTPETPEPFEPEDM